METTNQTEMDSDGYIEIRNEPEEDLGDFLEMPWYPIIEPEGSLDFETVF